MSGFRDAFPILQVADVRRSLGFYRDLLGFEVT
jgi:catechol 2,3-dioxygenase-like lactoylglutathione lyase family enzyme